MRREGLVHTGVELQAGRERHRIAFDELVDKSIVVYGQTEIVKDLIEARLATGRPLHFDVGDVSLHDLDGERPRIRYSHEGAELELACDVVAGCDGFHGVSRSSIPGGVLREFVREYPYGWLGILAAVPPSSDELVYANAETASRCSRCARPSCRACTSSAPRTRIWGAGPTSASGASSRRVSGSTAGRSTRGRSSRRASRRCGASSSSRCSGGACILAGDAAHIVPPTGAKGLNLAVRDVQVLAEALVAWYGHGDRALLDAYSETCLRRVWRAEHFSWWMTTMLHQSPHDDEFARRLRQSQLRYVSTSRAAATSLAENYVGLDRV